jgi:hypothetical protein
VGPATARMNRRAPIDANSSRDDRITMRSSTRNAVRWCGRIGAEQKGRYGYATFETDRQPQAPSRSEVTVSRRRQI